jgi:serine protease Do
MMNTKTRTTSGLATTILACIGVAAAFASSSDVAERSGHTAKGPESTATNDLSAAFRRIATEVTPAVVSVNSIKTIRAMQGLRSPNSRFPDSPLERFFGDDFFRFFAQPSPPRGYMREGLGTGVIVDTNGYVLTNNHVVEGADEVTVKLSDNRTFKAEVVGSDPKTDIAVLKVDGKNLSTAALGDSDQLEVGEWVAAVGNPFGLTSTVTAGIVSAKGRSEVAIADYEDFIQTDAAINPGNSGGPLVNLAGEVIGINTAIASRTGGYQGVGFAIPINMAKSIMDSLIHEGHVVRGFLGVGIQPLSEGLAESFGYHGTDGALIGEVSPGSPADQAGFKEGDIILRYEDKNITTINQLRNLVASTKPGTTVPVEIFRNGGERTLSVKIGALSEHPGRASGSEASMDLGLSLSDLSPEVAQALGYQGEEGAVVTAVDPVGPAGRAGIAVEDLIVSVQGQAVKTAREFWQVVGQYDLGKGIRLIVQHESMRRFVFLQVKD